MRWSDLSPIWQGCLKEAWQAFLHGTVPIGAVIIDENDEIIARGRNHIYDDDTPPGQVSRNQLAHAELNALLHFDRSKHNFRACSIYTSMEPCPLCMGAIYMMGIGQVHFAARDTYAGSTNLIGATPYMNRKEIRVFSPPHIELENALIGLVVAFDCAHTHLPFHARIDPVLAAWQASCPRGVDLGMKLSENHLLSKMIQKNAPADQGFDLLFSELEI